MITHDVSRYSPLKIDLFLFVPVTVYLVGPMWSEFWHYGECSHLFDRSNNEWAVRTSGKTTERDWPYYRRSCQTRQECFTGTYPVLCAYYLFWQKIHFCLRI